MKYLLLIFFSIFLIVACDDTNDGSTNHKFDPEFTINEIGSVGYLIDGSMNVQFYIDNVTGDTPYYFLWEFGDEEDGFEPLKTTDLKVIHDYKKQGIYNYKVTLIDNDKEEYTLTGKVIVKSRVDLAVQTLNTMDLIVDPESNGTFNINISNLGEGAEDPFSVKLYFSKDENISDDDILVGETEITSLPGGGIHSGDLSYKSPIEPGLYWPILKVDADSYYIERNESNNTKVFNTKVEVIGGTTTSPDLSVSDITLPEFLIKGDYFGLSFNVKNEGRKSAAPFSYKVILSTDDKLDTEDTPEDQRNDTVLKYAYVPNAILGGDSAKVDVERMIIDSEGDFYFFIVLDPTNDIKESNEDNNNLMSEKRSVGLTLEGVDILPSNISVSPRTGIRKGRTLTLSYIIKNRGDRPALGGNVRAFISSDKILDEDDTLLTFENEEEGNLGTIGPDSFIEKTHRVVVPDTEEFIVGEYYIIVSTNYEVDGTRPITEVDYSNNNEFSDVIEVIAGGDCTKDISIENFSVLPNPAFEGSPYTITFDISNPGSEEVTSFVTKIFAAPFGRDIEETDLKKNYNISRLASSSTLHKSITLELPSHMTTDKYCVMVNADATGIIGECDEENNIQTFCFDVTTRGDDNDITVTNVVSPSTILQANERVNLSFDVNNIGTTNSATFYCNAYFSPDEEFSSNDFAVDQKQIIYNVLGGETVHIDDYEILVPDNMGDRSYSLMVKCDSTSLVPETDETNNVGVFDQRVVVGKSTSGCNADEYELNETSETAHTLLPEIFSATLCDQDIDWYKFEMNASHKFRITMEQSGSDIDLILYKMVDGALVEIATSDNTEGLENIEKNILTEDDGGDYYLKVYPKSYDIFEKTDYTLVISYEEVGGAGTDLVLREVETDVTNIETDDSFNISFTTENLRDDATGSYRVDVYISQDNIGSPDDTLLFSNIYPSLELLETKDFNLPLTLTNNLDPGEYKLIVSVDPLNEIVETNEENNIYIKPIMVNFNSACEMDSLEPNSWDPFLGRVVGNGTVENLKVCKLKNDAYLLYVTEGSEINIDVNFIDDEGDIDIYLYKPTGTSSVKSSASSSDNESITYTATETGFYRLKIKNYTSGVNTTYSMTISGITTGYNLKNNSLEITSTYLEANEDFNFKYEIESVSTLNINQPIKYQLFLSENSVIDDEDTIIYEKEFPRLAIGEKVSETVKGTLPLNIETASYYFLSKIDAEDSLNELNEDDNNKYVRKSVVGLCRGDVYEINDSIPMAEENAVITKGRVNNLTVCPNDIDFYAISLQAGEKVFVNLYFTHLLGDIDLRLIDRDGTTRLAQSNTTTNNESLSYTVENSGIYYLRVKSSVGTVISNTYDLEVLIPNCADLDCGDGGVCTIDDLGSLYCECNDGYLDDPADNKVCHADPCLIQDVCQANTNCSVKDDFTALCSCNNESHQDPNDENICVLNTREHSCENTKDVNSNWSDDYTDGEFTQTWNDESKIWEPADNTECTWVCSEGYLLDTHDSCVVDPCASDPCGANEECTVDMNNFTFSCSCNDQSHTDPDDANACLLNTRVHSCENSKDENSDWFSNYANGEFTQTWNSETSIWEPADDTTCTWDCNGGYSESEGICIYDGCEDVTCSGEGVCQKKVDADEAECICNAGFHPGDNLLTCLAD